jgi:hypothetical protein
MATPTPLRHEPTTAEEFAAPVILLGLRALNERALLWLVTAGAAVCWGFTVAHPDLYRILAATLATVSVFIPVLWRRGE